MRKIGIAIAALLLAGNAFAQTAPPIVSGSTPTAAQWQSYFASKFNTVNGVASNPTMTGGTLTGTTLVTPVWSGSIVTPAITGDSIGTGLTVSGASGQTVGTGGPLLLQGGSTQTGTGGAVTITTGNGFGGWGALTATGGNSGRVLLNTSGATLSSILAGTGVTISTADAPLATVGGLNLSTGSGLTGGNITLAPATGSIVLNGPIAGSGLAGLFASPPAIGGTAPSTGKFTTLTLNTALTVANGGTGTSGTPTNGQIPIGNGTNYTAAALTQGQNVTITNGSGTITLAAALGAGTNALALGLSSSAPNTNALAFGTSALASATDALAVGNGTTASAVGAISIGDGGVASGTQAIAIGTNGALGSASSAIAIGWNPQATSQDSIAIGSATRANTGTGATAVGSHSQATAAGGSAFGYASTADGSYSLAAGNVASARGNIGAIAFTGTQMIANQPGRSQVEWYVLYAKTSGSTAVRLTTDGNAAGAHNVANLLNQSEQMFDLWVQIRDTVTERVATYYLPTPGLIGQTGAGVASCYIGTGTPALVAGPTSAVALVPAAVPTVTADTTNGGFNITVTPPVANANALQIIARLHLLQHRDN